MSLLPAALPSSFGEVINFYQVVKKDFPALEKEIIQSLHSRKQHDHAWIMYQNPELFMPVQRAWALWTLANSSYGCMLDGVFGYDRKGTTSKKLDNKRLSFVSDYAERLRQVQIECCDAVRIIKKPGMCRRAFSILIHPMEAQTRDIMMVRSRRLRRLA